MKVKKNKLKENLTFLIFQKNVDLYCMYRYWKLPAWSVLLRTAIADVFGREWERRSLGLFAPKKALPSIYVSH